VLRAAAVKAVREVDTALRAHVGPNPTEESVIAAFPSFFPATHMNDRQIRQYARSVVAGRPHFV
jgi:hypothetical protein